MGFQILTHLAAAMIGAAIGIASVLLLQFLHDGQALDEEAR